VAHGKKDKADDGRTVVARNRRAARDYEVLDRIEVGLVLTGSEVKSVRARAIDIGDAYAQVQGGELWLIGAHVAPYANAGYAGHDPDRKRKLLAHAAQIVRLGSRVREKGLTLIPLVVYFAPNGRAKVELGLARGKSVHGRKEEVAERDRQRDLRAVRRSHDADV